MSGSYSVDEASVLLGIPRPTLYRYLREYSIPNVRRSGKISIPEESVEKIRRVRDLHREGMGTGSVRRMISTPPEPVRTDEVEITARLDRISRELEGVKTDARPSESLSSDQALRTLLARQTVLISAVIGLTEMVEDLMRMNGQPLRKSYSDFGGDLRGYASDSDSSRLPGESEVRHSRQGYSFSRADSGQRSGVRTTSGGAGSGRGSVRRSGGSSLAVRLPARSRNSGEAASLGVAEFPVRGGRNGRSKNRGQVRTLRSNYGSLARRRRSGAINVALVLALGVLAFVLVRAFGFL